MVLLQRELARQTTEVIRFICQTLEQEGFPSLRSALCIGGVSVKEQIDVINRYVNGNVNTAYTCLPFCQYKGKACKYSFEIDEFRGEIHG